MSNPRVGVILSGCGHQDGAEIHEATCTLLALDEARAQVQCFAPDVELEEIDHLTGKPTGKRRSVLREAARIARGKIKDVAKADPDDLDALILPGGFGAAKNLCTFAADGANCTVNPDVERLILAMIEARKPLGFICIAPALAAKVLQRVGGAELTIGNDPGVAKAIETLGSKHADCDTRSVVVDRVKRIVSTPAYMLGPGIADINAGVSKLVKEVIGLCGVTVS